MDIQSRKIEFIQDFLKLESEEAIIQLEKLLRKSQKVEKENSLKPFTVKELEERISKSEDNFMNNKYKTSAELLAKY
ncbi:hypothetical protein [Pseudopedobacter beijingensis]|uniref:Addiction module component n=1 Tax=Pseudopedobacter beijingensis TaxID=1207056 RepID=A0ABW4IEX0_9SPHI